MGVMPVTSELRQAVADNLFPVALPAVEPWDQFPWYGPDTAQENSSQALAIDVFGTLGQSAHRDDILNALATQLELPAGGPWTVQMEWADAAHNLLRETALTAVDAVLSSPHTVIFCECKFTELSGAICSQRKGIAKGANKGIIYELQTNPANGHTAKCTLTAKEIRYWEVIPQVFDFAADGELRPCPFAGPWFQWMRNLTAVYETARHSGRRPAFLLIYADARGLPVAKALSKNNLTILW